MVDLLVRLPLVIAQEGCAAVGRIPNRGIFPTRWSWGSKQGPTVDLVGVAPAAIEFLRAASPLPDILVSYRD
jgi:hypothetical protein